MARLIPLLALLLLVTLSAATKTPAKMKPADHVRDRDLPPHARRRVMDLRKELQTILSAACQRLLYVQREIMWARKCLYNGLSHHDYERLRGVCKNRSESLDALRAYRRRCNHYPSKCSASEADALYRERQTAVAACEKIGWNGGKDCPNLSALKEEFDRTRNACRGQAGRVREIRKEINDIKGNFVRPSVAPIGRVAV